MNNTTKYNSPNGATNFVFYKISLVNECIKHIVIFLNFSFVTTMLILNYLQIQSFDNG